MGDQPRWPAGTPVAPSGKGPGGGRFRATGPIHWRVFPTGVLPDLVPGDDSRDAVLQIRRGEEHGGGLGRWWFAAGDEEHNDEESARRGAEHYGGEGQILVGARFEHPERLESPRHSSGLYAREPLQLLVEQVHVWENGRWEPVEVPEGLTSWTSAPHDWAEQVAGRLPGERRAAGREALEAIPLSIRDGRGFAIALFGDQDYYAPGGGADTLHAIHDYQSVGYRDVNPHLRNPAEVSLARYRHRWGQWESPDDIEAMAKVEARAQRLMELMGEHVTLIDRALDASRTERDVELWRGFDGGYLGDLSVGSTWSDGAYTSTTADREVASMFASHEAGGVLVRLLVPRGTPALRMSDFYAPGTADGIRGEAEVLLGRGLEFVVVADRGIVEVDQEADGTPRMARVFDVAVREME